MTTRARITRLLRREHGQTMSEAAVVLTVICAALVGVFSAWSSGIGAALQATVNVFGG